MSTPSPVPASLGRRAQSIDGRLVVTARFPSSGHLYETLIACLRVALGGLLLVLGRVLLEPPLAGLQGRGVVVGLTVVLAAGFLWAGVRGLGPLDPVRLSLGTDELMLTGPREAGLERPREAVTGRRYEHHRVALAHLRGTRLDPQEGLQLNCEGRSLVVPTSYRKLVSRRGGLGFEIEHHCFSAQELEWLAEQIDLARGGVTPALPETRAGRPWPGPWPWTLRILAVALGLAPALFYLASKL